MNILVIDAQGGGIGRQLISSIRQELSSAHIIAVGSNSTATAAMLKAGANEAATGENPVVVACKRADIIVGTVGIVIADSMLGEITPKMALAVAQSRAKRILIPFAGCGNTVVGVTGKNISSLIQEAIDEIKSVYSQAEH